MQFTLCLKMFALSFTFSSSEATFKKFRTGFTRQTPAHIPSANHMEAWGHSWDNQQKFKLNIGKRKKERRFEWQWMWYCMQKSISDDVHTKKTAAEAHSGCDSCQLTTGNWSYESSQKLDPKRLEKHGCIWWVSVSAPRFRESYQRVQQSF